MELPPVPMLPHVARLPHGADWGFEFKWDGMRVLPVIRDGQLRLYSRTGRRYESAFPELAGLSTGISEAVLDGEIVALDAASRPSFALVSQRFQVDDVHRAHSLARRIPVTLMLFDVLSWQGQDRRGSSYTQRRALLESLPLPEGNWTVPPWLPDGAVALQAALDTGLEGVVAKRLASGYQPGRTKDWVKVKPITSVDVVVGGYAITAASRLSLLLGEPGRDRLEYRGRVASGIDAAEQDRLLQLLRPLEIDTAPFISVPAVAARWVRPSVVVEVGYSRVTEAGRLLHPRYLRYRPDKPAEQL